MYLSESGPWDFRKNWHQSTKPSVYYQCCSFGESVEGLKNKNEYNFNADLLQGRPIIHLDLLHPAFQADLLLLTSKQTTPRVLQGISLPLTTFQRWLLFVSAKRGWLAAICSARDQSYLLSALGSEARVLRISRESFDHCCWCWEDFLDEMIVLLQHTVKLQKIMIITSFKLVTGYNTWKLLKTGYFHKYNLSILE